jgi:hypothetical protein
MIVDKVRKMVKHLKKSNLARERLDELHDLFESGYVHDHSKELKLDAKTRS